MREDEVAIEQLLNRYCHQLDRGEMAAVVELFAEDAVLIPEYEGGARHAGRAAVAAWYTRYNDTTIAAVRGLRHKISTVMIDIDGDQARASCYLDADSVNRATGSRSLVGGRYEDRLVRQPEGWRIRERRIIIDYASTLPGD
jgi:ketosteroid isomerase-like protein